MEGIKMRDAIDIWAVFDKDLDYDTVRCWKTEIEAVLDKDKCDQQFPSVAPHQIIRLCEPLVRMTRPKPCPFCGTEAMVITWQTNEDPRVDGWRCGCLEPDCDINPFTRTRWTTEAEAAKSWNHRSNVPVSAGANHK